MEGEPEQPFEVTLLCLEVFLQEGTGRQRPAPPQAAVPRGQYLDSRQHRLGNAWLSTNRSGFPFGRRRGTVSSKQCSASPPAPQLCQRLLPQPRHQGERNTLSEVQPPQGVDERGLAHVGHTDHQDAVVAALEVADANREQPVTSCRPQRLRTATTAKQHSLCRCFWHVCEQPRPSSWRGDLQVATLTPCVCTGHPAATSHLSSVVAWAAAHQLGDQGNDLERNTEGGCNGGSASRLEFTAPGGCAERQPDNRVPEVAWQSGSLWSTRHHLLTAGH